MSVSFSVCDQLHQLLLDPLYIVRFPRVYFLSSGPPSNSPVRRTLLIITLSSNFLLTCNPFVYCHPKTHVPVSPINGFLSFSYVVTDLSFLALFHPLDYLNQIVFHSHPHLSLLTPLSVDFFYMMTVYTVFLS